MANAHSRKKSANVTVDAQVLAEAKELGINLSKALEERLIQLLNQARQESWLESNREAIDSYNEHIQRHGCFGEEHRRF